MVREAAGCQVGQQSRSRKGIDQRGGLGGRDHRGLACELVAGDHFLKMFDHMQLGRLILQYLAGLLEKAFRRRVVAELLGSLGGEVSVLSGRCLSYGEGITYWPLIEIFRQADAEEELTDALAQPSPEETFWSVRTWLERRARERPLVLVDPDDQVGRALQAEANDRLRADAEGPQALA